MNAQDNDAGQKRNATAFAIDGWENEGGAHCCVSLEHHYGRRVETGVPWSVHYFYTGVPARIGDISMVGLSRRAATDDMLLLNRRNGLRRRDGAAS